MEVVRLAQVTRGNTVESVHRGVFVIVDTRGEIIANLGDPQYVSFIRSAAKPIQAIPVVERGAYTRFSLSEKELAIITASHSGEVEHIEQVQSILHKIGLKPQALQCGVHPPLHRPSAKRLQAQGEKPQEIHCACSGKHAGMLALAINEKMPLENYFLLEHPVQQIMLESMAEMAEVPKEKIEIGIDGCGVPVFGLTIKAMAQGYANLVHPHKFSQQRRQACQLINGAMVNNPQLVAGSGRFTTDLLHVMGGKIVAKDGAEGIFCLGIPEKGWGIALKVEDGGARPLGPIVLSLLEQLGLISPLEIKALERHYHPQITNHRGEIIGQIKSAFNI